MSAVEGYQEQARSSVKFSLNSKGEGQLEVKNYAEPGEDLAAVREKAQTEFLAGLEWLRSQKLRP